MDEAQELLDMLAEVLDEIREGGSVAEVRRRYNKIVNKYQRRVWRRRLRPIVSDLEDAEWLDDMEAMVDMLRFMPRIVGQEKSPADVANALKLTLAVA